MKKKDANKVIADEFNLKFDFCSEFIIETFFFLVNGKTARKWRVTTFKTKPSQKHCRGCPEKKWPWNRKLNAASSTKWKSANHLTSLGNNASIRSHLPDLEVSKEKNSFHSQIFALRSIIHEKFHSAKTRWRANGIFSFLFLVKQ